MALQKHCFSRNFGTAAALVSLFWCFFRSQKERKECAEEKKVNIKIQLEKFSVLSFLSPNKRYLGQIEAMAKISSLIIALKGCIWAEFHGWTPPPHYGVVSLELRHNIFCSGALLLQRLAKQLASAFCLLQLCHPCPKTRPNGTGETWFLYAST